MDAKGTSQLITDMHDWIGSYATTSGGYGDGDMQNLDGQRYVLALWSIGTYLWDKGFDTFPYVAITADTKRAGKTRMSEVVGFTVHKPAPITSPTGPVLLRHIRDERSTLIIDEAERMSSEAASMVREVMNVGYRRGQTIDRVNRTLETGIEKWPAYGPKMFILIGDVYDTLRDRSIVIRMRRGEPKRRFLFSTAEMEGDEFRTRITTLLAEVQDNIIRRYRNHDGLPFLGDRDEEIWLPLFAIAEVLDPERVEWLKTVAVDMATEKTAPKRDLKGLQGAEDLATADEYATRLLADMAVVVPANGYLFTEDVISALYALPTGPWRKFRGEGISANDLGNMLKRFGVRPRVIRSKGGRKNSTTRRGYRGSDIQKALNPDA